MPVDPKLPTDYQFSHHSFVIVMLSTWFIVGKFEIRVGRSIWSPPANRKWLSLHMHSTIDTFFPKHFTGRPQIANQLKFPTFPPFNHDRNVTYMINSGEIWN